MSDNRDLGIGGRNIVPSARRSIHSSSSTNRSDNMTRYGLDSASADEVDNVQSKMQYTTSLLTKRKNLRRHSITPPRVMECNTFDSDDNTLAKSLPATLPSHSNCSDGFKDYEPESASNKELNRTWNSIASPSSTSRSINSTNSSISTQSPNISRLNQSDHINQESKTLVRRISIVLIPFIVLIVAVCVCKSWNDRMINHVYDELKFHSDLNELGAEYKIDGNSILQLQTGISSIYKREDTSCLIFVYNSMSGHFDSRKFDGFVNNVASKAAKFLRNYTESLQNLVVEGSDLKMRSHSQLVKEYRENVAKTGVLLIRDIEHVPSPLAMAFHYYCDEYNPLVKKSAIFFTMNSAKCPNSDEKSSHASVEKCLKEKWSTVPKDNIGPLLTRVVSIVVDVTNGF